MKLFRIGEFTEVYAGESAEAVKNFYIALVGEQEAHESFESLFEEIPESQMDVLIPWENDMGEKIQTTWRLMIADIEVPCQVSTSYV